MISNDFKRDKLKLLHNSKQLNVLFDKFLMCYDVGNDD